MNARPDSAAKSVGRAHDRGEAAADALYGVRVTSPTPLNLTTPIYDPRGLFTFGYNNGRTLWHYTTEHAAADVERPGYFASTSPSYVPRFGDFVMVVARDRMGMAACVANGTVEFLGVTGGAS